MITLEDIKEGVAKNILNYSDNGMLSTNNLNDLLDILINPYKEEISSMKEVREAQDSFIQTLKNLQNITEENLQLAKKQIELKDEIITLLKEEK